MEKDPEPRVHESWFREEAGGSWMGQVGRPGERSRNGGTGWFPIFHPIIMRKKQARVTEVISGQTQGSVRLYFCVCDTVAVPLLIVLFHLMGEVAQLIFPDPTGRAELKHKLGLPSFQKHKVDGCVCTRILTLRP